MRARTLILLTAFLMPLPMMADDATYYFNGNNFTTVGTADVDGNVVSDTSPYSFSDSVSGWFRMPDALSAGTSLFNLTSYSFSDGLQTINSSNGAMAQAMLFIDADGNIADWIVIVQMRDVDGNTTSEIGTEGGPYFSIGEGPFTSNNAGDAGVIINADGSALFGESNSSGTWTESATPEPSSIILLLTGLAGIAGVARRKLSHP
jgi:hypothetical protein